MAGYPVQWFVGDIDESLKCGICSNVLKDPTVTKCGHIYCGRCIVSWAGYYGVCPERCMQVDLDSLQCLTHMDLFISGLLVHCKNRAAGCRLQIKLAEKYQHEQACPHRATGSTAAGRQGLRKLLPSLSQQDLQGLKHKGHHKRTKSSGSSSAAAIHLVPTVKRTPSSISAFFRPSASRSRAMPVAMNSKGTYSTHVFRLKRTKTKESLGLVLVTGDKTPEGVTRNFRVKKVHPNTLGWKAGVQAQDRIVQVDQHDIADIGPQESVVRIKDRTLVTLTIHRGLDLGGEHLYDEIFYSDSRNNSQDLSQSQDENTPSNMTSTYPRPRGRTAVRLEENQRYYNHPLPASTPATPTTAANGGHLNVRPVHRAVQRHSSGPLEKGSKDSGLSSDGSTHQDCMEDSRHVGFTGTPEPYHVRMGSQGSHCSSSEHSRIEGNYEVEDICLQKNGTSQLGVTLGYDTKSVGGQLVICEVLPNGLAADNGRLKNGDIVRKVNGFEVHDPEEAVLLFLEQDQDITLTVARPVKASSVSKLKGSSGRHGGSSGHLYPGPGGGGGAHLHHLDTRGPLRGALEGGDASFRRVDSCGSLDAHRPPSPVVATCYDEPISHSQPVGGEKMRRTKSASSTSKPPRRRDMLKNRSPPARQPSPLVTDSQQPVYQVLQSGNSQEPQSPPIYHVLQQPGSPQPSPVLQKTPSPVYHILQQAGSPQPSPVLQKTPSPVYHILQQTGSSQSSPVPRQTPSPVYNALDSPKELRPPTYRPLQKTGSPKEFRDADPVYHVLQQQPDSPQHHPPSQQQPVYHILQHADDPSTAFQHEECRPLTKSSGNKGSSSFSIKPSSNQPLGGTGSAHYKHCLNTEAPGTPTTSTRMFRSIASEIQPQRCDTAPAGYPNNTVESLV